MGHSKRAKIFMIATMTQLGCIRHVYLFSCQFNLLAFIFACISKSYFMFQSR